MDDRKKRRIGFLICIAFVIFIVTALLIVQITIGSYDLTIKADKDAYVYEYNPETNYGEDKDIFVGNYNNGKTEAYYHFNISSLPDGWRDIEIQVYFDYSSDIVDVGCNLSYEKWSENTITWNNKPNTSFYFGHALCDGIPLNIFIRPEHIINNEITICLYGKGGEDDGYIQGPSREGTPGYYDRPYIVLEYKGLDLIYLRGTIIAYAIIIVVIGVYLIIRKKFNFSPTPRTSMAMERLLEHQLHEQRLHEQRLNELLSIRHRPPVPINRPLRGVRLQPSDFYKPIEIFKINELVDLRLFGNRTYLFVNNKLLKICTFLLINIPKDKVRDYDEIKSIDEAAELLDRSLETTPPYFFKITPEEEFKAHCSNIQAFFENGLNTNILHTNIAFPLLKELVQQGFQPAQKVFKEEIAIRFNEGTFNSRRFLYLQGYLNYLSEEEKQVLKGYDDFIKKMPERTANTREMFMRERILNERRQSFRGILERENGRRIFNKIVIFGAPGVGKNTLNQGFLRHSGLDTRLTMGLNFGIKNVSVNNQPFELRTWNMVSSEHFRTLSSLYFRGAIGGIFIYDITNQSSLTHIDDYLFSIQLAIRGGNRFPIIVVGNKSDLSETRKIPVNKAIKLAKSRGMNGYIECSFRTGKNVEKIFERLVRIILKKERENT